MALIHEKFYQSEDLAKVDFGEYVRTLVADLYNLYDVNPDVIELKIDIDHVFLGIDSAIPSGLIINELVSNSLKHAFPAGRDGEIIANGTNRLGVIADRHLLVVDDGETLTSSIRGDQFQGAVAVQICSEHKTHSACPVRPRGYLMEEGRIEGAISIARKNSHGAGSLRQLVRRDHIEGVILVIIYDN